VGLRLRLALCAAVAVVGMVQVSVAFSRSLIPHRIDGRLEKIGWVSDSRGRIHTITVDGRTYETDNRQVAELREGRWLSKDAWEMTLRADHRKGVRLPIGDETFQYATLTLLAFAVTWHLTR